MDTIAGKDFLGDSAMQTTSYVQTQAMLHALEYTLERGGFGNNLRYKKAAQALIQQMRSHRSVSGRQQQLASMLRKGATIEQMMKATRSSRRTVFRYLNYFEEAGMTIELSSSLYRLK